MAEQPADRTAEAYENPTINLAALAVAFGLVNPQVTDMLRSDIKHRLNANYGKGPAKVDKMHVYVDGQHKLSVDADKAHAVARTYMAEGRSVWVTRRVVTK